MWSFLTSKIGVYAICIVVGLIFIGWTHYEMDQSSRAYECQAMLNRSVIILREKKQTDAAVSAIDGRC